MSALSLVLLIELVTVVPLPVSLDSPVELLLEPVSFLCHCLELRFQKLAVLALVGDATCGRLTLRLILLIGVARLLLKLLLE